MTQPSTPPLAGEARDEVQEAAARLLADAESWEGVTSPAARNIAADIRTVLSALRSLPGAAPNDPPVCVCSHAAVRHSYLAVSPVVSTLFASSPWGTSNVIEQVVRDFLSERAK